MRKQDKIILNKIITVHLQQLWEYHLNALYSSFYSNNYAEYFRQFDNPYDYNYVIKYFIQKMRNQYPYSAMIWVKKRLILEKYDVEKVINNYLPCNVRIAIRH